MRLARHGLQIALVAGALALSAPTALAVAGEPAAGESTGAVRVTPERAFPGSTVTVSTTACGKETYGKGESEAGGQFHLFAGDRAGVLVGEFRLPEDAASGTDTVTLKCPPRIKQTVTYSISGRPHGGVAAGLGWAAGAGADTAEDNSTGVTVGWLLLGGAVTAGVIRARRRATRSGTSA